VWSILRLLFLLLIPAVASASVNGGATVTVNGETSPVINQYSAGGDPAAYFGNECGTPAGYDTYTGGTGIAVWTNNAVTCPGDGTRTVDSLEVFAKNGGGSVGNVNMALYDSTGATVIATWTGQVAVSSGTASWITGTMSGTPTCTGGTTYLIAVGTDTPGATNTQIAYTTPGGTNIKYKTTVDYTTSFPEPLPTPTGTDPIYYCLRAHVAAE